MQRVSADALRELDEQGFTVVEGLIAPDEVAAAREVLWSHYPRPDEFFAAPERYPELTEGPFAGLVRDFPFAHWDLARMCFHPSIVDAAERFLGSDDLSLYKVELWAKYASEVDYDQAHHRDYGNHTLVVPRADGAYRQLTTFTLLSDVTEEDGPTRIVPLRDSAHIPLVVNDTGRPGRVSVLGMGELADVEVPVVGPAGTVLFYRTDVFHRGSAITGERRSRFTLLLDFERRGPTWTGKVAWPNNALHPNWIETMVRASVRERDLFGFPKPGDPYWDEQTLTDVAARYPGMDMSPYRA